MSCFRQEAKIALREAGVRGSSPRGLISLSRCFKMKISKLEEGLIEMDVRVRPGNNEKNYFVTGKYVSGKSQNSIAFSDIIPREYNNKDPSFSAKDAAAYNFALELRIMESPYQSKYVGEKIEVVRKVNGNN